MKLTLYFVLCIFSLFKQAFAEEIKAPFIISYVEHDSIINFYVPLLDRAYRSIGITPEFIQINDKRALKLLNQGEIDADTAKSGEVFTLYPNIIKVPTPISKIQVMLICQLQLNCDLSVLKSANKMLGLIAGDEFYSNLLGNSKIRITEVSSFKILLAMFKQKRVDYIFMVFDEKDIEAKNSFKNKFLIEEKIGFHILHKKHRKLLPRLDKAIKLLLNTPFPQTIH
ncbi:MULTISPECIES: hypothetical protein [Thalassotalea]|uniref:Solute-binding protein family 3/N-terminal domain-containing protein n=1 Tax=Thalassotalea castellviae TaxID=3075612 RepID=A0ABU3A669_9GAMM|nr:hypothetical protein [Thalassotalea sp. W431]MDT0604588.1 hypothetical protein [Thalassotalea sp. W431]